VPDAIGMVLAFYRLVLEHTLSEEERSQILQTIEMFEVITQTQHDDYQSLEILKVAYHKLGKAEEALRTSRRLAEAYFNVGSFSLAMQECEAVLTVEPSALEIVAMLGEIEARLQQAGQIQEEVGVQNALVAYHPAAAPSASSGLLEIGGRSTGQVGKRISLQNSEQGNDQLGKFLVLQQMFPEDEMSVALEAVKEANKAMNDRTLATSLLEWLCQDNDEKMEAVLSAMIDRTKFAYVPLEYYDIDRQVVRMLPDELTIKRLFVPFDLISRTIMVAVCNPFDAEAREAVQQSLDYNVMWYLTKPATIIKTLQEVYKLEPRA
jgi:tetratricopeptide (TPR) repeat protein